MGDDAVAHTDEDNDVVVGEEEHEALEAEDARDAEDFPPDDGPLVEAGEAAIVEVEEETPPVDEADDEVCDEDEVAEQLPNSRTVQIEALIDAPFCT